jgi:2-oxoglutarate ferredoxin oxidoreductase subunit beta
MRRNVNIKVVLFNNQIYGLTKGQYSPTSEAGKITKSSPWGSIDHPFNPVSLALGAEASYVARSIDMDRALTERVLREAYEHRGAAFIEIYQNCNVFNNHAFLELTSKEARDENRINLEHGKPIVFGPDDESAVIIENGAAKVVPTASVDPSQILVHDEFAVNPSVAFSLSRLSLGPHGPTPIGVFRNVERLVYEDVLEEQIETAQKKKGVGDINTLVRSMGTWTVE